MKGGRKNKLSIEDTLIQHPDFALPGRKALLKSDMDYEVVLIDAAKTPIERPKKIRFKNKKRIKNRNNHQKRFYSGKKRRHTLKTQLVVTNTKSRCQMAE